MFQLDERLAASAITLGAFPLSLLLLSRDANYPWFLLVPQRQGVTEIFQLESADQQQLMAESCHLSRVLMAEFAGDKLNVAALGNQVPQLHLHHVVRYRGDPAWPGPVWGAVSPRTYEAAAAVETGRRVTCHLELGFRSG